MSTFALKSKPTVYRIHHTLGALFAGVHMMAAFAAGCGDTGVEAPASCSDGIQNGSETGIDCGGTCAACTGENECRDGTQCPSGVCVGGTCQAPSCSDGVKNGDEVSVDCGGACAAPESCNGKDDDCNGMVDDAVASITCGVGACQRTVPGCTDGQPSDCEPEMAGVETCDGLLDEDCDGTVDNGCSCKNGDTQSCYTGSETTMGVGACVAGTQICESGAWGACSGEVTPSAESCDGIDNDCNGATDDGIAAVTCGVGACAVTVSGCENGQPPTCTPGNASAEICDGIDNDCNGTTDDGIAMIHCGVGACEAMVSGCENGQTPTCTPGTPSAEMCDGIDNDCNGSVDDGIASISCGVGACEVTVPGCTNGQPSTCMPTNGSPEVCDGIDNDCNGVVDNDVSGVGAACTTGNAGICAAGTTACDGGAIVCNQISQASMETCDGSLDEDCDGQVDDGCMCTNGTTNVCYSGPAGTAGVGPCKTGLQTCVSGVWSACMGEVLPSTEACDNVDNDCNGQIDNGNPGGGASCNTGNLGICAAGTQTCSAGVLACVQNSQPAPSELCNTTGDDNCNGQINEGCACTPFSTQSCYTGPAGTSGVGACKAGTRTCNASGTAWGACTGEVLPSAESCKNNLDDDCDGQANEGCSALTCQNFYYEDFNDGNAGSLTSGVYQVDWCNSSVATAANTPACMVPGQTTRTNANGGTNAFVGIWVSKATASCTAVRLSYDWYQFANAGAVVEYKQTSDTFASYSSCSSGLGWTTAVPSSSMSTLNTCNTITNINIPFGNSPAVYIKFKSTNAQNNAMWWDDISLTLVGCDC